MSYEKNACSKDLVVFIYSDSRTTALKEQLTMCKFLIGLILIFSIHKFLNSKTSPVAGWLNFSRKFLEVKFKQLNFSGTM